MLSEDQMAHFKTFGFVVMRSVLTEDELKTVQAEFDHRAAVASGYEPFDGTKRHGFDMMGVDTPFYASLMEDRRLRRCS